MIHPFFAWIAKTGNLEPDTVQELTQNLQKQPFSLYREVNFLIYAGLLVFTGGLGILIYENIGSFGHILLILTIFSLSGFGIWKAFQVYPSWNATKIQAPSMLFAYMVLGSAMLFLVGEGYLEYRFSIFENQYRLLGAFSAIICFCIAYRFDHQGVLTIAISTLAATVGLTILPGKFYMQWLEMFSRQLAMTEVIFGMVLLWAGFLLAKRGLKAHFESAYATTGATLLAIGVLFLQINSEYQSVFTLVGLVLCGGLFYYARRLKSVYIYLIVLFSGYFTFTYLLFRILEADFLGSFILFYSWMAMGSLAYLLIKYKKILQIK